MSALFTFILNDKNETQRNFTEGKRLFNMNLINSVMKCEKCDGEARINSRGKLWCKNYAMLVHACKCNLTRISH